VQDGRGVERRRERTDEAGAAAAGLAGDEDRSGGAVGDRTIEPGAEVVELRVASDERTVPARGRVQRGSGAAARWGQGGRFGFKDGRRGALRRIERSISGCADLVGARDLLCGWGDLR
jgi:hypothetical protein